MKRVNSAVVYLFLSFGTSLSGSCEIRRTSFPSKLLNNLFVNCVGENVIWTQAYFFAARKKIKVRVLIST